MIELNALRYFTSAYETGTFSHAARVNGVSQPTVSAAIQRLEDRLGAPLFRRSRAGLAPTPLATALYHDVIDSVSHLATLEARVLRPDDEGLSSRTSRAALCSLESVSEEWRRRFRVPSRST